MPVSVLDTSPVMAGSTPGPAAGAARLTELAAEYGRTPPEVHVGLHAVLGDGPADRAAAARMRESLVAFYVRPADEMADATLAGRPDQVAERLAEYAAAGAHEVGLGLDGDDVERQIALADEVRALSRAADRAPAKTP